MAMHTQETTYVGDGGAFVNASNAAVTTTCTAPGASSATSTSAHVSPSDETRGYSMPSAAMKAGAGGGGAGDGGGDGGGGDGGSG
jgi:hypothetical protein